MDDGVLTDLKKSRSFVIHRDKTDQEFLSKVLFIQSAELVINSFLFCRLWIFLTMLPFPTINKYEKLEKKTISKVCYPHKC